LLNVCFLTNLVASNNDSLRLVESTNTIFKALKSSQVQEVTIQTDIAQIIEGKRTKDNFPAILIFRDAAGNTLKKSIELTPANHNVLKEFLAYKIYHELTENSLDVQLLKINYEDIQSDTKLEKYAILLEDIDEFAESVKGKEVEGFGMTWKDLQQKDAQIMALFQYLIGNDDWTVALNRNIKFIEQGQEKKLMPIPYDFDSSGFVSTAYAKPNPDLKMQSVKQRFFMGRFNNKTSRNATIDLFRSKEKTIYRLVNEFELLEEISKLELKEYLDSFYKTIHSPELVERAFPIKRKRAEKSDLEGEMHF